MRGAQPGYRRNNGSLVVELEAPAPEHTQRLYATLGVLVRFVPPRTEE